MPRDTLIQIRRGTFAEWDSANPTLAAGELAFVSDRCQLYIGDGTSDFRSTDCILSSGTGGGGGGTGTVNDVFKYINVSGQELIIASGEDTLNLLAGHGVNIVTNSGDSSIAFSVVGLTSDDISDFDSAVTGLIGTDLQPGNNIAFTYNVLDDALYINATGVVTQNSQGDVYILGDLDVVGDLNIQGSSTIFNSTNVNIGDNIITLNIVDVVPSGGILVVRSGITPTGYASFLWQENNNRWEASSALYSQNLYADTISATTISGFLDGSAACSNNIFIQDTNPSGTTNSILLTSVQETGCQEVITDTNLIYDSSASTLISTYFSGTLLGYSENSYKIDAIEVSDNIDYNVVLVQEPGSGVYLKANSGGLYYNPHSQTLHSPTISGAAVGPANPGINSFIITNYTIANSKIDGGTP